MREKAKGLPDGSNIHLMQMHDELYCIWRSKKGQTIWSVTTTSAAIAEFVYSFED